MAVYTEPDMPGRMARNRRTGKVHTGTSWEKMARAAYGPTARIKRPHAIDQRNTRIITWVGLDGYTHTETWEILR